MSQNLAFLNFNRFLNPNTQFSVGAWVTFADGAVTAPVDGIGGSPNSTITRTESTPLDGMASLLFTKNSGASRQGEGASIDMNLSVSDQTKIITFTADYQITTGTYSEGSATTQSDLTWWVYDVTNSVMYQTVPSNIGGNVSTVNQYQSIVQWQVPQGCLTARLIMFIPNTTNSSFTVKFNNVAFARVQRVAGPVMTQLQGYTAAYSAGFGTVATFNNQYAREGQFIYSDFTFTAGTVAASTAFMNLPTGFVIDSTALSTGTTTHVIGQWIRGSSAGTNAGPILAATGISTSVVYFGGAQSFDTGGLFPLSTVTGSGQFNSAELIRGWFKAPIAGWGANATIGQDTDTRVVSAKYTMSSTYRLNAALPIPAQYDTKVWDTHSAATYGTGVTFTYFAPVGGYYQFRTAVGTQTTTWTIGATFICDLYVNGSIPASGGNVIFSERFDASASRPASPIGIGTLFLKSGDAVVLDLQTSVSTQVPVNQNLNLVEITRMSGPAQVQSSDAPVAGYNTAAGQAIANASTAVVNFDTVLYDTFGLVTTGAAWKFTANRAGKIEVGAMVTFASGIFTLNNRVQLYLYKNGALYKGLNYTTIMATVTDPISLAGSAVVTVIAGDTLDIRVSHGEATSRSLTATGSENYVDMTFQAGF